MQRKQYLVLILLLLVLNSVLTSTVQAQSFKPQSSYYIAMPDGTQIAIEVYLPATLTAADHVPSMLQATRYWRAMPTSPVTPSDPEITAFTENGYAVVVVDARGSGASTGSRSMEWSKAEIEDYRTVIDWIVAQKWSNGRVGTWGVSYPGNTAELIASLNHPAVKVVAPLYDDFDPHFQLVQPGGVFNEGFIRDWGTLVKAMDSNDICTVAKVTKDQCGMVKLLVSGVKPVDSDKDGKILAKAVSEHAANLDVFSAAKASEYRDSAFGMDQSTTLGSVSPYALREQIEASKLPMIIYVGWLDADTVDGTLARLATFSNPQHVVIGPFSHGGGNHTDPFLPAETPVSPSVAEQFMQRLSILDAFLKGDQPAPLETNISYYTLNAGTWSTTDVFPPAGYVDTTFYFAADGQLSSDKPTVKNEADTYQVDFTASSGETTRWHTQLDGRDVVYPNRAEEDKKLLTYTSEPLPSDAIITGNPEITLYAASTETDGAFHVYLELVAPDGKVTYVTEGMLRGIHRKVSEEAPPYTSSGAYHSYLKKDAEPLVPGEITELRFNLYATSVLFHKGDRIRIAVAGHDASLFAHYPAVGDPVLTVQRNAVYASHITLPMKGQ